MSALLCQSTAYPPLGDTRAGTKSMQDQWDDRRWQPRGICPNSVILGSYLMQMQER
jgi:hypothetical protein